MEAVQVAFERGVEIPGDEPLQLGRHLVLGVDRRHRTGIDARAAVDALIGVDDQHPVLGAAVDDAVNRADIDARSVLQVDAGFSDDIRHFV